jgi:hypothetical protein
VATWVDRAVAAWADRFDTDEPWRDKRQKPFTGDVRVLLKLAIEDTIERAAQQLRQHPGASAESGQAWARQVRKLATADESELA